MDNSELIRDIVSRVLERIEHEKPGAVAAARPNPTSSYLGMSASVDEAVRKCHTAQQEWMTLKLEQRRTIIERLRERLRSEVEKLSRLAVEETGLGRYDDKLAKNRLVIDKTPGIEHLQPTAFSGDHGLTVIERAPYGVIGSITPCTNPTETIINNALGMISGGNGVVFNPHPTAGHVSAYTVGLFNEVIAQNHGPRFLVGGIEQPTIQSANDLMKHPLVRLLVVTGGPAVVKAAMNSGKKVIAAGPGNPPVVVDETADLLRAAKGIIRGASLDNNIVCIAEKEVFAVASIADQLKDLMTQHGAYEVRGEQLAKLETLVLHEGHPHRDFIGKDALLILSRLGVNAPPTTRLIIVETKVDHPLVQLEMMMPVLPIVRVRDVDEAIRMAKEAEHGHRHTAGIYSRNIDAMDKMARAMNCSIFVKNAPHFAGLGLEGEGYTSFTIASPTGEGLTTVRDFTRVLRCTLQDYFRFV